MKRKPSHIISSELDWTKPIHEMSVSIDFCVERFVNTMCDEIPDGHRYEYRFDIADGGAPIAIIRWESDDSHEA